MLLEQGGMLDLTTRMFGPTPWLVAVGIACLAALLFVSDPLLSPIAGVLFGISLLAFAAARRTWKTGARRRSRVQYARR